MRYGLMTQLDYATMDKTLELVCARFPEGIINTLELGVHRGDTSRGIRDFFKEKQRINFHTGIDSQKDFEMQSPFPECHFIIGNTMDVYNEVKDLSQHFLLIDANHSYAMTMIDFLLYSDKVAPGGYIAFHDTGAHIKPMTDYQGMGSKDDPDFYISCRKALEKLKLLYPEVKGFENGYPLTTNGANGYYLVFDEADVTKHTGGITVFQKLF